jgi:ectoine hydroxylase-related dioxygenase (phytanoyl-CoA dioxygenase family)
MSHASSSIVDAYRDDGFVFPIDVLNATQASEVLQDLEAAEAELADDAEKLAILRSYPDRVLPSFDQLIRHPVLVNAASQVLGPDLMVWSASLFMKQPQSSHIVSWHQDLTYWGLDDAEETTGWVALSPATIESGCMQFVPGSHKQLQVPHEDTFDENNLLSRGQEIAVEVDEGDGVAVELQAGQASLHHGHLFHSSGPNRADYRRVGAAIRYIKPSMKQQSGDRSLVALVSGSDQYNHFTIADAPKGRLHEDDFELCRRDIEIKRRVLYEGAEGKTGQRY